MSWYRPQCIQAHVCVDEAVEHFRISSVSSMRNPSRARKSHYTAATVPACSEARRLDYMNPNMT